MELERVRVNLTMPVFVKKELERLARESGGTLTSYVSMVLSGHIKAQKAMSESGIIERLAKMMENVTKDTLENMIKVELEDSPRV